MKILHITSSDSNGAGIAAIRILEAERMLGHDVKMIVRNKFSDNKHIKMFYYFKYLDYLLSLILRLFGMDYMFSFNGWKIINSKLFREADIIHIHNIHHTRMLFPTQLPKKKKYVYTLHDMWAMTGFCNYTYDICDRYLIGCGNCLQQKNNKKYTYKKMLIDRTSYHWKVKKKAFEERNIIFTAPSNWLVDLAKKAPILSKKKVYVVPNCIEINKKITHKKPIQYNSALKLLFVGQRSEHNDRKGFEYIVQLCNKLKYSHEIHIVGKNKQSVKELFLNSLTKIILHGPLEFKSLTELYKSSDILLLPSLQDNFPNTILESFAFGTPVVAFNTGGIKDLVSKKTGYLANYKSVNDLLFGVEYTSENLVEISKNILSINHNYSYEKVGLKFEEIYTGPI